MDRIEGGVVMLRGEDETTSENGTEDSASSAGLVIARHDKKRGSLCSPRRCALLGVLTVLILVIFGVLGWVLYEGLSSSDDLPTDPLERAFALLGKYPLVDCHNDLASALRQYYYDDLDLINLTKKQPYIVSNIPALESGGVGALMLSAWVDCNAQYADAVRIGLEQVDVIKRIAQQYPSTLEIVTTSNGLQEAFKEGKIAALISLEGGHIIDSSLAAIRMFYDLGVRSITLTHSCNTPWAQSCSGTELLGNPSGLSDFGVQVVREMNRLGMIVDLSHAANNTQTSCVRFIMDLNCGSYTLCPMIRNVADPVLDLLKENGGLIAVTLPRYFINCTANDATIAQLADHIDYVVNRIGISHVGIGTDLDGCYNKTVPCQGTEMTDPTFFPYLVAELIGRGYTDEDIEQFIGGNFIRVMSEVEAVSEQLKTASVINTLIDYNFSTSCRTQY